MLRPHWALHSCSGLVGSLTSASASCAATARCCHLSPGSLSRRCRTRSVAHVRRTTSCQSSCPTRRRPLALAATRFSAHCERREWEWECTTKACTCSRITATRTDSRQTTYPALRSLAGGCCPCPCTAGCATRTSITWSRYWTRSSTAGGHQHPTDISRWARWARWRGGGAVTGNRAVAIAFPTRTATWLAERVVEHWHAAGLDADVRATTSTPHDGEEVEHLLFLLPVLGDERMPDAAEASLRSWAGRGRTHRVCLTGDFRAGQRRSPVATEADRLLSMAGSVPTDEPLLIDTPVDLNASGPSLVQELASRVATPPLARADESGLTDAHPENGDAPCPVEEPLRRLLALLPSPPQVRLGRDGRCRRLSLVDGAAYPRSCVQDLDRDILRRILRLAGELTDLRWFGLAFAGFTDLPAPLPHHLDGLDLRGNPLTSFALLDAQPQLRALNLAGCNLEHVPDAVQGLGELHTLVLAKNRLVEPVPELGQQPSLRRLTLYRNQVRSLNHSFAGLRGTRVLNLGANPVSELPEQFVELENLEVLGLRLLPIERLPSWLAKLPALREIDVSKTRAAAAPELLRRGVLLREGMPSWAWDDGDQTGSRSWPRQTPTALEPNL